MRLLITGRNGTVAPKLAALAESRGADVVAWDRSAVDPNDPVAVADYVAYIRPDGIAHLAFGAEAWAGQLAGAARARTIPFVYTSTTMVFAERPDGPYTIHSPRTATDEYGQYKIRCEDAIWGANPEAMIARLGYQIDLDGIGNNMVAHADAQQAAEGVVRASTEWIASCAFIADTVTSIVELLEHPVAGLHHLDSNAQEARSYFDIIVALRQKLGRDWNVEPVSEPVHDQRLLDSDRIAPLRARLD